MHAQRLHSGLASTTAFQQRLQSRHMDFSDFQHLEFIRDTDFGVLRVRRITRDRPLVSTNSTARTEDDTASAIFILVSSICCLACVGTADPEQNVRQDISASRMHCPSLGRGRQRCSNSITSSGFSCLVSEVMGDSVVLN